MKGEFVLYRHKILPYQVSLAINAVNLQKTKYLLKYFTEILFKDMHGKQTN